MRQFNPSASTGQVSDYYTSLHGQELRKGNPDVAECASCHTAHAILPARDARSTVNALNVPLMCDTCHGDVEVMGKYGRRANQFEDYAQSVHGVALLERHDTGAPACNDCHGNHGAAPPGLTSIENVCGMCHVNNAEYFSQTGMSEAFADGDLHACEECHGIHDVPPTSDEMIGVGDASVCTGCHDDGDEGYDAALEMSEQIAHLKAVQDSAYVLLERVERAGMNDIDIAFLLQDSHQSLIQTRTLVHTFNPMETEEMVETGLTTAREAIALGHAEVEQYRFRRMGFGIATLMITLLTVALFFKIREMEQKA
jgi:predicted CXXCH cytochrome family protein